MALASTSYLNKLQQLYVALTNQLDNSSWSRSSYLFVLVLYVPFNTFSVMSSGLHALNQYTKQNIQCLAQGYNTVPSLSLVDFRSNTLPLSHCAPILC